MEPILEPIIDITIAGRPVPNNTKAWYNKRIGRVLMYKPPRVKDYKKKIQRILSAYMIDNKIKPTTDPVVVCIDLHFKIPASYSKKDKEKALNGFEPGKAPCPKKPDIDNCQKTILDALSKDKWNPNDYVIENDSQVCAVHAYKYYDNEAYVRIKVIPWEKKQ